VKLEPRGVQRLLRRVLLLALVFFAVYLWRRLEWITLPADGCSPLLQIAPGTRLVFDTSPPAVHVGDVVLFEGPGGKVHLGQVHDPAEGDGARPADALWILTDDPDCPGLDSRDLGWIPEGRVRGRLLFGSSRS